MDNWPCESLSARDAFETMLAKESHSPVPMPAFDVDGSPIPPRAWQSKLRGVDVLVKFKVSHQ